jgi:hypothetical protein
MGLIFGTHSLMLQLNPSVFYETGYYTKLRISSSVQFLMDLLLYRMIHSKKDLKNGGINEILIQKKKKLTKFCFKRSLSRSMF